MKISALMKVIITVAILMISTGVNFDLGAADLKIASQNVSKISSFAGNQSIRIFQGLEPDIALLQEWCLAEPSHREYVDQAFGPDFYYYLASDPGVNPVGNPWAQNNGIVSRWMMQTWGGWEDTVGSGGADFAWAKIDLPGSDDILVVSAHLKAGAGEETRRLDQAQLIKSYVETSLALNPSSTYVVVGGDLNVENSSEWCLQTFATFLEPDNYRPQDRFGNKNTNQNRSKPYDWIMPNQELDDFADTLVIGTEDYEYDDGIVFDSHVFCRCAPTPGPNEPLWNIQSIRYGDSHSSVMDHMAVMRVFDIFPSPTPSPSTTPSLPPTATPTLTPEGTATPAPTPTPEIHYGPIAGRVFDRETGEGISGIYVRASNTSGQGAAYSGPQGYYSTGVLNIGMYTVYANTFSNRDYRSQYYNQKDRIEDATRVPSDTTGIDFPLYRVGVYPTPAPTPTPLFIGSSIDTADYDGDGTSDFAIFRRSSGLWAIRGITRIYFGAGGDTPVAADFDGDDTSDIGIFRPGTGLWAIRGISRTYFGQSSDIPLPGDYDGDGYSDIAVFRGATGLWAVKGYTRLYFGNTSDRPVPFYSALKQKQIAIFRGSSGLWAIKGSTRVYFGSSGDTPLPADYRESGSGRYYNPVQLAIFRNTSALWAIRNTTRVYYGTDGDYPVPGNYRGRMEADISIFRPGTGLWSIRGHTKMYFGTTGDLPVAGLAINPSGTI